MRPVQLGRIGARDRGKSKTAFMPPKSTPVNPGRRTQGICTPGLEEKRKNGCGKQGERKGWLKKEKQSGGQEGHQGNLGHKTIHWRENRWKKEQ